MNKTDYFWIGWLACCVVMYIIHLNKKYQARKSEFEKRWTKSTSDGRLYIDTKHPGWKEFFVNFIKKNAGKIKIKR
jgi:hypothetical protein